MKESAIHFFKENISFRFQKKDEIIRWLTSILKKDNHHALNINIIFCNDKYLRSINKKYLQHDYNTDILTFDNTTVAKKTEGDIFISIDTVKKNSKRYSVSFDDELHRVMAHGILHLLGYKDSSAKEKMKMRQLENFWLGKRKF
jgi:rRNA maturation RNase YbeY